MFNSRSPLSPLFVSFFYKLFLLIQCRGDSQERSYYMYSRSPLSVRLTVLFVVFFLSISCRGEYMERRNYFNSRSPFMKYFKCIFDHILQPLFLTLFMGVNFMTTFTPRQIHRRSGLVIPPLYMYIYSLRPFLTTKGALIDGD